jgi:hypothetical protein
MALDRSKAKSFLVLFFKKERFLACSAVTTVMRNPRISASGRQGVF